MGSSFARKVHLVVTAALVVAVSWIALSPNDSCAESHVWEKRYEQFAAERAQRDAEVLSRLEAIAARQQERPR